MIAEGLTWDHPRGYVALAAAAAKTAAEGRAVVAWSKQPLEGFESHPIAELAARYDLLVLDHPHIGEAVEADCLVPLEALFTADDIAPAMNYDISGFPQPIYEFKYPAPGHPGVAREVERMLQGQTRVEGDTSWGLDHGTWLPLKYMFPAADIPVLQLSIDYARPPAFHYELAKRLRTLRSKGVLIIGSGNVVHNLGERGGTGVSDQGRQDGSWATRPGECRATGAAADLRCGVTRRSRVAGDSLGRRLRSLNCRIISGSRLASCPTLRAP